MSRIFNLLRPLAILVMVGTLASCVQAPPRIPPELPDLGNFRLGHNVVTGRDSATGPVSRGATEAEWQAVLTKAIEDRLGQYEGEKLYHIGISVDGFSLNPGGIPVVANVRSLLGIGVTVWDDAKGGKINQSPKRMTIFESASAESLLVPTGLTKSKKEQMEDLARNAADQVVLWLIENREWFDAPPPPETVTSN